MLVRYHLQTNDCYFAVTDLPRTSALPADCHRAEIFCAVSILHYIILYYVMLCYIRLSYVMLNYITLYIIVY